MITFKFNTDDIDEEIREAFTDFEISFPNSEDDNVSEMANKFKKFLLSLGYLEESINEYIKTDEDIKEAIEDLEELPIIEDEVEDEEEDNRFVVPLNLYVRRNGDTELYTQEVIFNPDKDKDKRIDLWFDADEE